MVTFLIFLAGFLIGVVSTLLIGAWQHSQEVVAQSTALDPALVSQLASYIIEHNKLKELEK